MSKGLVSGWREQIHALPHEFVGALIRSPRIRQLCLPDGTYVTGQTIRVNGGVFLS